MRREYKYFLTEKGKERIENGEFYLEDVTRGLTIDIFGVLSETNKALSVRDIQEELDLPKSDRASIATILYYNYKKGYLDRIK